jgi:suppressor for copper-sensitivity B
MKNHPHYGSCLRPLLGTLLGLAFLIAAARPVAAFQILGAPGQDQGFSIGGQKAQLGEGDRVPKMEAGFTKPGPDGAAQLYIVATMPEGAHTYSITQPEGGPIRTKVRVDSSAKVPAIGKFHTVGKPKITRDDTIFPGVPMEEQAGKVKWFAPIKLAAGTKAESLKIEGNVYMQLCDENGCAMPKDYAFTATYQPKASPEEVPPADSSKEGGKKSLPPSGKPAAPPDKVSAAGGAGNQLPSDPSAAGILGEGDRAPKLDAGFTTPGPDGTAQLFVNVMLPPGVNTYSITQRQPGPVATSIRANATTDVLTIGAFAAITPPEIELSNDAFPGVPLEQYRGTVKWVAPIRFAPGAHPESVKISGEAEMQLCEENKGCIPAKGYPFTAVYRPEVSREVALPAAVSSKSVPASPDAKPAPPQGKELSWRPFTTVANLRDLVGGINLDAIHDNLRHTDSHLSVFKAILLGLLGGLILNIMPCVLPVISLKILSFVQQSGHSRGKAFALNLWYSAGLLTVFLVLASLAVGPQKLGWGQLFGETWFPIALSAVVFVMGLSFMGLWEVPLPAFAAGGKAGKLAGQEGAVGAFFKGALTTLLATPCSAPFLAPALVWAASQPPWLTYVVFTSVGLGMASPYLLIGAFPELLRFLPKPGAWMETFKQAMGFVLMGTVVYLLTVIEPYNVIPTVGLLFALWLGCWWIGRISPLANVWQKLRAWSLSAAFCGAVWIAMFPGIKDRALGSYSFDGLSTIMQQRLEGEGEEDVAVDAPKVTGPKIVLIDFTADWCFTCKTYEAHVMRTEPVVDEIHKLGVVTLKADWTHHAKAKEVTQMLDVLGSRQIPVIAIFSPSDPNNPTVFRGGYTQQQILDALHKAANTTQQEVASR